MNQRVQNPNSFHLLTMRTKKEYLQQLRMADFTYLNIYSHDWL